ncbi:hypothetical protein [Pelagibius sp. Alg239-R121]|uniref:hypothetical protein n=1 Tax=Pelagibius sp. Alg239-R121 TaxID=2993448 RepID=UPI0024A73EA5|nr:hypothetical protein [Pelagibius sp. Alg239-R121]
MHKAMMAAVSAAFLLAGCASSISLQENLQIACRAYSASLTSLAGFRAAGRLTDQQIAAVDQWRPTLNEACSGGITETDDLLNLVESGVVSMIFIEEEVRDES